MNILYLHGFAAKFDTTSVKPKALMTIGDLHGFTIDYTKTHSNIVGDIEHFVNSLPVKIDIVIGISLGGYFANVIGSKLDLPFVMINPSIDPQLGLQGKTGLQIDFNDVPYYLHPDYLLDYELIGLNGVGLVLLDEHDEVIDSKYTYELLNDSFECIMYYGGSHGFEHIEDSLHVIKWFYENR